MDINNDLPNDNWILPNFFFWMFNIMLWSGVVLSPLYGGFGFEIGVIAVILGIIDFCIVSGLINIISFFEWWFT